MKDTFGHANGDVLTGVERAAHTGRRITARRARRQKRARHSARSWSIGPLAVTPAVAIVAAILLVAAVAGAAVALGGSGSGRKQAAASTTTARPVTSATHPPTTAANAAKAVYIRFTDAAAVVHYMYCTATTGCGLLNIAKDGSSKIAITAAAGVWHLEKRQVVNHDPCINIVENGVNIGKPGDFALVATTDLHAAGTQTIKGIRAPARITGTFAMRAEYPIVPGCTFTGTDYSHTVDAPVTEYVPVKR